MLNRKLMIWAHDSISLVLTRDHTPRAMSRLFYIFSLPSLLAPSPNRLGVCVQHVFPWSCHHFKFQVSQYRARVKNLESIARLPGFSFSSASFQLCDIVWGLSFCKMGRIITVVFCYRGLGVGERGSADLCVCQFPWCKYCHPGSFHATNTTSLNSQLGWDAPIQFWGAGSSQLPHSPFTGLLWLR